MRTKLSLCIAAILIITNTIFPSAGITPYVRLNEDIYFLLGVEKRKKQKNEQICITDFGGYGTTDIHTAAREGYEETMGIFTAETIDDIKKKKKIGMQYFIDRFETEKNFVFGNKKYKTHFINVTDKAKELVDGHKKSGIAGKDDTFLETIIEALEDRLIRLCTNKKYKRKLRAYKEKRGYIFVKREDFITMIEKSDVSLCQAKFFTSFGVDPEEKVPQAEYIDVSLKLYRPFAEMMQENNEYLKLLEL